MSSAVFKGFKVGDLTFIALKTMADKDLHRFRMPPDYITNNHILCDHDLPRETDKKGDAEASPVGIISGS
jgi:hypothetical protein